jgi:hypothetical protein
MKKTKIGFLLVTGLMVAGLWFDQQAPLDRSKAQKSVEVISHGRMVQAGTKDMESSGPQMRARGRDPRSLFRQFLTVHSKALKTEDELLSIRSMLSSPKLIEQSFEILSAKSEKGFDLNAQELRMQQIEFLAEALSNQGNPQRNRILEGIQGILNREVQAVEGDPVQKRSLAGDQIELFQILQNSEPTLARAVEDRSIGTANEKLIAYALKIQERI